MQHREVPLTPDAHEALLRQRKAFIEKFGREPGPDDPVFFDPDANTPQPLDLEGYENDLAEAMAAAGIDPRLIYASRKTGLLGRTPLVIRSMLIGHPVFGPGAMNADEWNTGQEDRSSAVIRCQRLPFGTHSAADTVMTFWN